MSEREIKVGSKWRNVHGEVTVDRSTDWEVAAGDMHYNHSLFRATHEWVSDPAPAVKVGDWVEYMGCHCIVVKDDTPVAHMEQQPLQAIRLGHVEGHKAIPTHPLIAALDELSACFDDETGFDIAQFADIAKDVATEYRAIKRKLGVES